MTRTHRRLSLAVSIGLIAALVVARAQSPAPQTRRLVSLVPAVTEMLFAIGAGSDVVGVGTFDAFPPEVATLPRIGALLDPDVERILSLRPTLAVIYGSQDDLHRQLARATIPTFDYRHGGLDDIPDTIRTLGDLVGRADRARALATSMERSVAATRARYAAGRRPKTMIVFSREANTLRSVYVAGGVGFLHGVMTAAGAENAFGDVARESLQASYEQILTRAPEVIVEVRLAPEMPLTSAQVMAAWQTMPTLPAVKTGRIYLWSDTNLVVPGPRVVDAIPRLADLVHR
ncbi:MAG: ABC transporter substrate-binding protein [Vicinamibacterales bacterium]